MWKSNKPLPELKHASPSQCAWLAGFFDGDGFIYFVDNRLRARVCFGQKDPSILLWVQERFGGHIRDRSNEVTNLNQPRGSELQIRSRAEVERFILLVGPYVRVKSHLISEVAMILAT